MDAKENRVILLRTTKAKLLNDKTKSPKLSLRVLFQAIKWFLQTTNFVILLSNKPRWLLHIKFLIKNIIKEYILNI